MKISLSATLIGTALFYCFLLGSCKKDAALSRAISYISVNNASNSSLSFSVGGRPLSSTLITRGMSTGYVGVYEGKWPVEASLSDTLNSKIETNLDLKANEYNSLFVINADTMQFFTITDNPLERNPERANIKFLNLSPDAPSLSLEMRLLNTSKFFEGVKYKSYSAYQEVDEKSSYTILLKNHAVNDSLMLTIDENFEKGKIYTIWTTGSIKPKAVADSLRLHITELR